MEGMMSAGSIPPLERDARAKAWPPVRREPRAVAEPGGQPADLRAEAPRTSEKAAEDWVKERLVDCYNG